MIETMLHDIRLALRTCAKAPTFSLAVIATIALGVGATTAIFTVVNAVLLRPLPFPESERAVVLCETNPVMGDYCGASPMNVADWTRAAHTLESAGVARTEPLIGRSESGHYSVEGAIASPGFFRVLQPRPVLGRLFEDRDMDRRTNHVVLVSYAFWQRQLNGDRTIVGKEVILDEQPFTVIGVLPEDAYFPERYLARADVWKPLTASIDNVERRRWRGFTGIGRMAAGASLTTLHAELQTIRKQLAQAYPADNKDWGLRVANLRDHTVGDVSRTLWIFLGAVGFVLLIASANVASLLLVRATGRASEFAVRASLGAPRIRLVQQLITESVILSLAGGAVGLLLATWVTSAFVAMAPSSIPRLGEVGLDARVVLFAFLLSTVTAVIFGLAPARLASKTDLNGVLKGIRATGSGHARVRSGLVVAQLALALMLLVGAGLLTRTFARLLAWDPGFDRSGVVTTFMVPPARGAKAVVLMGDVRDAVAALPGVQSAALGSGGPLFEGGDYGEMTIEGRPPFARGTAPRVDWFDVDVHYFNTIGLRLLRGRQLTPGDTREAPWVAIVNETLARKFFGGSNAIGQRVTAADHTAEIVGIVADVAPVRPDEAVKPKIYWPIQQYLRGAAVLIVRTKPGVAGIEKTIRARVASINPAIQLGTFQTLDEDFDSNLVKPKFNMALVAAFAIAALLLAAVGVYGVVAYTVASRTREIGVRMALGATSGRLIRSIVGQGMKMAVIGVAIGCVGALACGRLLASLLYGLPASDPMTIAGAVAMFAVVVAFACWLPARRASRVDPISALRE